MIHTMTACRSQRRLLPKVFVSCIIGMTVIHTVSAFSHNVHKRQQQRRRRRSRFVTTKILLPPLPQVDHDDQQQQKRRHPTATTASKSLPVVYTNDPTTVSSWLRDNIPEQGCTLGFDVESAPVLPWSPNPAFCGPAVVQLATVHSALVVHLTRRTGSFSRACQPLLESVLNDERIVIAGCAIDSDMLELKRVWGNLEANSRWDLGGLRFDQLQGSEDQQQQNTLGLKLLSSTVLDVDLPKCKRTILSDWSQFPLTVKQISYAARDAWAGAAIANALASHDPDTFRTHTLVERLATQPSVAALDERLSARRNAKELLSALLAPPGLPAKESRKQRSARKRDSMTRLPPWKADLAKELKEIIRDNRQGRADVTFTVSSLTSEGR